MSVSYEYYNPNKTSLYFYKANKFFVNCGLPSFIKWQDNIITTIHGYIRKVISFCTFIVLVLELGSYITQKNLTEKQASVQLILSFLNCIYTMYYFIIKHHKEMMNDLLYKLCITLKNVHNDPEVERQMIQKSIVYSGAFMLNFIIAMLSYGVSGLSQYIGSEGTFVTVITAWPDVADKRTSANVIRVVIYLVWWICMSRVTAIFVFTIITTGYLSYQYKHIQSYFYSLNDMFDAGSSGENCEQKYEDALKVGIQLHADTLGCTKQCQRVCSVIYSAQVTVNVTILCVLMLQMVNAERTLSDSVVIILTACSLLTGTGLLMWNAGDITVEAALVPSAIYCSGWQHCRGKSSRRIRTLLVIAMSQAQRHVVIRSFGVMEISHQACVSIVKASYSVFSLLY